MKYFTMVMSRTLLLTACAGNSVNIADGVSKEEAVTLAFTTIMRPGAF